MKRFLKYSLSLCYSRTHHHSTGVLLEKYVLFFQGRLFEQTKGAVMDSSTNLIVAKLYMEDFNIKAIRTAENPQHYGEGMLITH